MEGKLISVVNSIARESRRACTRASMVRRHVGWRRTGLLSFIPAVVGERMRVSVNLPCSVARAGGLFWPTRELFSEVSVHDLGLVSSSCAAGMREVGGIVSSSCAMSV